MAVVAEIQRPPTRTACADGVIISMIARPQIEIISSTDLTPKGRAEILQLCCDAYEMDFAPYLDLLNPAVHVLLRQGAELIAHAAWVERRMWVGDLREPLQTAYIEAVAVAPAFQGQGFGRMIMEALPPLLADFDLAALTAAEEGFYQKLGWRHWQGALSYRQGTNRIETPDECVMIYCLPKTPLDLNLNATLETDWRQGEVW